MDVDLPFDSEPIGPEHSSLLKAAFQGKRAWCYYAPFMHCFSLPPGREVRVARWADALFILVIRHGRIDLMVPPLPFSIETLLAFREVLVEKHEDSLFRILWMDEEDARQIAPSLGQVTEKEQEYLYEPARVVAASGGVYRDLRKRLRKFQRTYRATFRCLDVGDLEACQRLLKHWRKRQGRRHPFLLDWGYTKAALDRFDMWDRKDLQGWCVDIEGDVRAFALGGRMQEDLANFFVAKTDPDVPGLSEYLRWQVYRALEGYRWVNDAGDLGLPGLRQFKQKFRPVARLPVYSAQILRERRSS